MTSKETKIPLIALLIMIVSSFVPVGQIFMLLGQAIFLYPFENIFGMTEIKVLYNVNLVAGILTVVAFYFSKRKRFKILWSVFLVFFFMGDFAFLTEDQKYNGFPHFMPMMVMGCLATLPLVIAGLIKEKSISNA